MTAAVLAACLCAAPSPDSRERDARAALALAGADRSLGRSAPAPHAAAKPYAEAWVESRDAQLPLVVFVDTQPVAVPGAVLAKQASPFAGYGGPAVLVGVPTHRGAGVVIDAVLEGEPSAADVRKAVAAATKKIDRKPGAKPLDWSH
jgi:hypothetical protein